MKNNRFKQRVIGALVLVSLAVIFIPMILTGQGSFELGPRPINIPPEPQYRFSEAPIVPEKPLPDPQASAPGVTVIESDITQPPAAQSEAASSAVVSEPPPVPTPDVSAPGAVPDPTAAATPPRKGVAAWAVQVGSFNNKTSAFQVRDVLRSQGFAAYVERVKVKSAVLYRVRVGPELQRPLAEELQEKLAQAGHSGIVVSHR